jgi:hypothetical protein
MRLNGRRNIMHFLGVSPQNRKAWHKIRERYGAAIYRLPGSDWVWALPEDLIAVDKAQGITVAQWLQHREPAWTRDFRRFVEQTERAGSRKQWGEE